MQAFPTTSPYRIDQVTAAPLGMTLLFLLVAMTAAAISWAALRDRWRLWWACVGLLLLQVTVFFTLASWGNSDTTKLSHFLAFDLSRVEGEPFWMAVAPLIVRLPYRMSAAHGMVSAGYAAAGIFLARRWRAAAWAGWWALLLCCSPLLRNFLQNAVTRQALMTLVLLPVFLRAARLVPAGRLPTALATLWAATIHNTFVPTLLLCLLPSLAGGWRFPALPAWVVPPASGERPIALLARPRSLLLLCGGLAALILLAVFAAPVAVQKFMTYLLRESYSNRYPLASAVGRVQLAMALGAVLTCWERRLGWRQLRACPLSRSLGLFALLYLVIQGTMEFGWLPQLIGRFADPVGFFLLMLWLGWLDHYGCRWAVLPALVVTLEAWFLHDLLGSHSLRCGWNDDFLCLPDRWPWQVRYGSAP